MQQDFWDATLAATSGPKPVFQDSSAFRTGHRALKDPGWLQTRPIPRRVPRDSARHLEDAMQSQTESSTKPVRLVSCAGRAPRLAQPLRHVIHATLLTLALASPALCQSPPPSPVPPVASTADLSGPRFGFTFLPEGVIQKLAERDIEVGPNISQFGWQLEKLFYTQDSGVTMVTEWIGLLGGLEQGVALPSLSWMVGVRTRDGAEFGIGPNVTPAGTSLVLAAGMTFRTGALNVPLNVAILPSKAGARVSVLSGIQL